LDYWQLTLATGVYFGSVVIAFCSVTLAGLAIRGHLAVAAGVRKDMKQLLEGVQQLLCAEERRFLKELNFSKTEVQPSTTVAHH
jgi:hypothetical protein